MRGRRSRGERCRIFRRVGEGSIGRLRHWPGDGRDAVEKVVEQPVPVLGEYRLGVKLQTVYRVLEMLNGHDLAVFGGRGNCQTLGREAGAMARE